MRVLCLIVLLFPALHAQDAREILRRSIEIEKTNRENWINYTYLERQFQRQYDGSGKLKSEKLLTYDVTNVEGSPIRRLVARNDKPISAAEEKAEQEKLQRGIEERRKETPEQRERRVAEWRKKQDRQREPLQELADAFDLRITGEVPFEGRTAWVIDGTPRPGYKPKSTYTSFLPKMKARFWIAKNDFHWMKIEAETTDTISYGLLFLRIGQGAHIVLEQTPVGDGVWLPKRIALNGAARILLFKSIRAEMDYTYSKYRKFTVDSRVVEAGPR